MDKIWSILCTLVSLFFVSYQPFIFFAPFSSHSFPTGLFHPVTFQKQHSRSNHRRLDALEASRIHETSATIVPVSIQKES